MSPNTKLRVLSAVVILLVVIFSVVMGPGHIHIFIGFCSLLVAEEIWCNFLQKKRDIRFVFMLLSFLLISIPIYLIRDQTEVTFILSGLSLIAGLVQLSLLFFVSYPALECARSRLFKTDIVATGLSFLLVWWLSLLPVIALGIVIEQSNWRWLILVLILVNYGMDTGAWFFGKRFGKHKLAVTISPNKTVEGLIGGLATSAILGSLSWALLFGNFSITHIPIFAALGLIGQLGDLVQSKLKRVTGIKDSSQRIPGHGGVYDRVDSLFFTAPFYVFCLQYLLQH